MTALLQQVPLDLADLSALPVPLVLRDLEGQWRR